jgi:very-short-patch-repair endonuclease
MFDRVIDDYGLPQPVREYQFFRYRFDFAWPKIKVAVEIDGTQHLKPGQYQSDRKKDNLAQLHGWVVLRADRDMARSYDFAMTVKKMIDKKIHQKRSQR